MPNDDLELSLALTVNPRTQPIVDGDVGCDGVRFRLSTMHPSEMFWRQLKFGEFDVSEMSVASLMIATSQAPTDWVAIPVFTMRHFFHTSILVRKDSGIEKPADLKGKRVGVPEYQQTWAVWSRGILKDEFGIEPRDLIWHMERNPEKSHGGVTGFKPPDGVRFSYIPLETNMGEMMVNGELDATLLYMNAGNLIDRSTIDLENHPAIRTLFPDPAAEAQRYFAKTGNFPINHGMVVRRSVYEKYPWVALNVYNMMTQAKEWTNRRRDAALEPYVDAGLVDAASQAGLKTDPMPYGVVRSRAVLENIARYLHEQGLAKRRVALEEIFAPSTLAL